MKRVAPELLFMSGAVSQYLGAVVAVGLFAEISPGGTAWLRVLGAAAIIVILRRSWRRSWKPDALWSAAKFGVALAAMNLAFYLAIDELPLGNAVAIEFLGPLTVAAIGTRTLRAGGALMLAVVGVLILAGVEAEGTVRGVSFALLAGLFWAMYIVLGHRVARSPAAIDGLGLGMLAGAIAISPFGVPDVAPALETPWLLVLGLATACGNCQFAVERRSLRDRSARHATDRPAPVRSVTSAAARNRHAGRLNLPGTSAKPA